MITDTASTYQATNNEELLIGLVIRDNTGDAFEIVSEILTPEHFSDRQLKKIWEAAILLQSEGKETLLLNLAEKGLYQKAIQLIQDSIREFSTIPELWHITNIANWLKAEAQPRIEKEKRQQKALAKAKYVLTSIDLTKLEQNIELEKLRHEYDCSSYHWKQEIIKSLKEELKEERLKLEVQLFLQENDPLKRLQKRSSICGHYQLRRSDFNAYVDIIENRSSIVDTEELTMDQILFSEDSGLRWLFPGIIPATGVTLIGGIGGSGKSTLAYDLAGSLIYDEPFLGERPTIQGEVLFAISDEPKAFIADKLMNRGISEGGSFLIGWNINHWDKLERKLEAERPALLIVDSLSSITASDPNLDLNNNSQARRVIDRLSRLSEKYNCAVVLIHHLGKSKDNQGIHKFRNASSITEASSTTYILQGEGEEKHFISHKTRGTQPLNLKIKMDAENGRFEFLSGNLDQSPEAKSNSERVLEFFHSLDNKEVRLSFAEINDALPIGKQSLYKVLDRLTKRGSLIKRYSLTKPRCKVWGLPKCSTESKDTTNREEKISPPPPIPDPDLTQDLTNENTNIKEIQKLDTLLDTHSTVENGEKEKTFDIKEIQKLDTTPQEQGGGCKVEAKHTTETEEKSAPEPQKTELTEEAIADAKDLLSQCDSIEVLEILRDSLQLPELLKEAAKQLSKEQRNQIKEWVIELNRSSIQ